MFKHLLPTMMFCAFIPLSSQANPTNFTLQEAQNCTYTSLMIDDKKGATDYYSGLTEDSLDKARFWADNGDARLANHFYDQAEHFNGERNHYANEANRYVNQYNTSCTGKYITQEVYNQACQGIEENFFCRAAGF